VSLRGQLPKLWPAYFYAIPRAVLEISASVRSSCLAIRPARWLLFYLVRFGLSDGDAYAF
jgi:hypothetical protein